MGRSSEASPINLVLHVPLINDIYRAELQRTFFPQMYHDMEPAPRLKPGDMRMCTGLKVFIELRDGATLQVPFREASKVCRLYIFVEPSVS